MPIDLTTVPEGQRRSHRSRRRRDRQRRHFLIAIFGGLGLIVLLGAGLYINNHPAFLRRTGRPVVQTVASSAPSPDPVPLEKRTDSIAQSVAAVSSEELPEKVRRAKLLSIRRVSGGSETDLQVEYEFQREAASPANYRIAIQTPQGTDFSVFNVNAARHDVVQVSLTMKKIHTHGPISVWIETFLGHERISNIMTIP